MANHEEPSRMSRRILRGFDALRFRAARETAGLTRGDLARLAQVSAAAIAAWENERNRPQVDSLARAATTLKVEMHDLVVVPDDQRYLSDLRVQRGLTQPQLGKLAGVSTTHLGALERGETGLTEAVATRLATALAVTPVQVRVAWERARSRPPGAAP
jgi:transcriptional regulator with XRE-family HTH domain